MLSKKVILVILVLGFSISTIAQNFKTNPGYKFTKEEISDVLLERSKQQKTKAFVALISGPVITVAGVLLFKKEPSTTIGSNGWLTVRSTPSATVGSLIAAAGIITTLTTIPLFISSATNKKKAKLILTDETISFFNQKIMVPSVGIHINL